MLVNQRTHKEKKKKREKFHTVSAGRNIFDKWKKKKQKPVCVSLSNTYNRNKLYFASISSSHHKTLNWTPAVQKEKKKRSSCLYFQFSSGWSAYVLKLNAVN